MHDRVRSGYKGKHALHCAIHCFGIVLRLEKGHIQGHCLLSVLVFDQTVVLSKRGASGRLKSSLKPQTFSMFECSLLGINITKN